MTDSKLKLDLGCGRNKKEGFLGIDRREFPEVDATADLTTSTWVFNKAKLNDVELVKIENGWKLPDNSVEEVHTSHFVEHLNHNSDKPERVRFVNELYRVLVPGGKATVITPHWCSNRAYGDFTHADKPVSEMWYYYLSREWRKTNAPDNDAEWNPDGYNCDFSCTWGYTTHQQIQTRHQEAQSFALTFYKEAAQDIVATLVKV